MRALRIALVALCVAASALFVMGCSHRSGHKAYGWGAHNNMHVENTDRHHIHVIVDGGEIGTVGAFTSAHFNLTSGFHDIAIREGGSTQISPAGVHEFNSSDVVHVVY